MRRSMTANVSEGYRENLAEAMSVRKPSAAISLNNLYFNFAEVCYGSSIRNKFG